MTERISTEEALVAADAGAVSSGPDGLLSHYARNLIESRKETVRLVQEERTKRYDAEFDACALARALWQVLETEGEDDIRHAKMTLKRHAAPHEGFVHGGPCGLHGEEP